ncbi:uncharacterized protein LOC112508352 isoform X2 [Cynara cardunculus var. scolymus]|uniref:uncharacterized protein LOC112508352 isoform X2 n=1 Tax=Cynara cardunculus var. scolymus TaxID=59895 RepID=UPI000D62B064|nr:uncharacterized protein LOC112508352 isoform X2 [Cynara cardunculus var. scolymus]
MNTQDHSKTGDEGHGPHICHRCGWPFPNSHPSPKHRRAHKRICGTIEGYTKLIESEAISDDEHHSDEDKDKDKTPSPKIEKGIIKESGNSAGGTEDDSFSDAMTEFSDSGISPVATKLLDSPIEVSKADDNLEVFKTPDTHTKDADETEENDINTVCNSVDTQIKLLDSDMKPSDPLIEDRDGSCKDKLMDLVEISNTVEMKPDSANAMDVSSKNVVIFEVSDKDQEEPVVYVLSVPSDIPLVDHSETLIDDFKDHETIYSNVPMVLDHDTFEVKTEEHKIQESQASETGEFSIDESIVSEHPNTGSILVPTDVTEEVKESETKPLEMSKTVPEAKVSLGERTETASKEINQEKLEFDHEHAPEVVKNTEIDHGDPVLTEEDPASERPSEAYTQEFVKEPESGFEAEQKIMGSVGVDSKESGNLGISQRSEKLMPEKEEQWPTASGIVSGTLVDEDDGKLMTNQDSVVDASVGSSSRNSLEGNWGSVSVLSTASVDVENAHSIGKSEIVADKSRLGKSEGFQGQSLVELKEEISSETQNSEPPKSEAKIVNESEGRKRNEEAIAKVTNWSTELSKNVIRKDEVVEKSREAEKSNLTSETPSPPKYIGDGKKVRKKGKGRGSWIPFGCCSSVNVN